MTYKKISKLIKELPKRFENILNTPKFDRRLDKRNNGFRKKVINEKGNVCSDCKRELTNKEIEVSHLLPVELYPEFAFEMWNVFIKCHSCNLKDGHYQFRRMRKDVLNVRKLVSKTENYFAR